MKKDTFPRILICLSDLARGLQAANYLKEFGYATRVCKKGGEAKEAISTWGPSLIVCDLLFPQMGAFAMLKWLKSFSFEGHVSVIVVSDHNSKANVEAAFALGANDYMTKPIDLEDLLGRVVFHGRKQKVIPESKSKIPSQQGSLHINGNNGNSSSSSPTPRTEDERLRSHKFIELLLTQAQSNDIMEVRIHNLLRMANVRLKGVRVNLVKYEDQVTGYVVASHDCPKVSGLKLNLEKYPEILMSVNTNSTMIIENLENAPLYRSITEHLKSIQFNSLIVCPVSAHGQVFGTLGIRLQQEREIAESEIIFAQILAKIIGLSLSAENDLSFDDAKAS